jgi:ABC-2 type transport system permease protein
MSKQPGVGRRIGSAIVAAAAGLIVGSVAAAVISAIVLLAGGSFEYRSLQAIVRLAIGLVAEGMFWALLGGSMFVLPPAVLAIVVFRPRNTQAAAIGLSVVLLVPLLIGYYPGRTILALIFAVPIWLGVRVAFALNSRMLRA